MEVGCVVGQALPCCHLLLGREGGTGWLLRGWGGGTEWAWAPGWTLSFGKASMMFPPPIFTKKHIFLHNLVK